jgi:hypothetical protein
MHCGAESIKIDLSKAGQCNVIASESYFKWGEGCVAMTSFSFVSALRRPLCLKGHDDGKNALHCVLLHRPSADKNKWLIIDPTYVGDAPVIFKDYMKVMAKEYEGDVDYIRIKWDIHPKINRWLEGYPNTLEIEWGDIIS